MCINLFDFPTLPNFCCCQDPHGELQGQNVLIVRYSVELTAAHFGISVEKVNELLASARAKMAEVRKSRPRPHLDTKMLASWNGSVCNRTQCSSTFHMSELQKSIFAGEYKAAALDSHLKQERFGKREMIRSYWTRGVGIDKILSISDSLCDELCSCPLQP